MATYAVQVDYALVNIEADSPEVAREAVESHLSVPGAEVVEVQAWVTEEGES